MIHRFRKVSKDLYRGSAPSPVDVVALKHKFGIKKIVSLDEVSGRRIHDIAKKLNIEHVMIPLDGSRLSLMHLLAHDLKKLLLEGGPTYVHCMAGKDRTGLVVALVKCKYLGEDPEKAIEEAKSLGFGIGVNPKVIHLYEKIIRACKPDKDNNDADIVSTERSTIDDNRGSILDSSSQGSFAPFLDQTKTDGSVYMPDLDQSPSRQNINDVIMEHSKEKAVVPVVGLNNNSGQTGFGPVDIAGGFFYD